MKILLLGSNGQLGTDLVKTNPGHEIVPLRREDCDVTDAGRVEQAVQDHRPQAVINTAAYNRTEEAEEHREEAFLVNAQGPCNVARSCARAGARLLHFSTDYVFNGRKGVPYVEGDRPAPLSAYGESKLEGEMGVMEESSRHVVVRGSSLFGAAGSRGKGGNFVEAVIQRARAGQAVEVVEDIVMSPTYTMDLARLTWTLVEKRVPGGIYHGANAGACSWFEFAREAFSLLGLPAPRPVRAEDRPSKILRPACSALASEKLPALGIPPMRPWREALRAYLEEKGHLRRADS